MKKILVLIFGLLICSMPVAALELDMSVDEEIKKKYNSNKLNEEVLPALPATVSTPSKNSGASKNTENSKTIQAQKQAAASAEYKSGAKIPAWTKFQVRSDTKVNDWLAKGSSLRFTSTAPVYVKSALIPAGTTFKGIITDIHRPQYGGNGGLVEIKITSMSFGGKTVSVNGKVTKASGKKIFFNNIKGERKYLSSVEKQINKGEDFYNKSRKMSSKLAANPVGIIIAPIPVIAGWAGYAVCTVISPVTGLNGKGNAVSFPAGSLFEIKLLDNVIL